MSAEVDTINIRVKVSDDGTITIDKIQGKIGRATEKITGHFDKAKKGLWETFKGIAKTAGILVSTTLLFTSLSGAVRGLARDAIDFNREFTQVRTLLDESKTEVAGMEQKILAMGGALGDVTSIAKGTYQMISSGQDAESALQKIGEAAKFAQGGQVALRDAVSVGTVYLNAYGKEAGGLAHVYDVLWQTIKDGVTTAPELAHAMGRVVPIAKEVGLSIEEVSGSIAIMTQISQNTNESVTALRGILSEIIKPSDEAAKEAERLGINFSMAGVKAMGFSNWLADLVQKVKQGDGDMAKLFGRVDALNGIFQLTRNSMANYREEMEKMDQVTGNNEESFRKYKESFQGAWETMKNKLQAIFIQNILPLLKDAASWISENSENISNFVKSAISGFKTVVGIIGEFKDVIIIAGKAWLTYFAASKILPVLSKIKTGIFGVTTAVNAMNVATQLGNAQTMASLGGMVNYMKSYQSQAVAGNAAFLQIMGSSQATLNQTKQGLSGVVTYMQRSQSVGVRAFTAVKNSVSSLNDKLNALPTSAKIALGALSFQIGWEIGSWINNLLGLQKKIMQINKTEFKWTLNYRAVQAGFVDIEKRHSALVKKNIEEIRSIGKEYKIQSGNILEISNALRTNKKAFESLTGSAQEYIRSLRSQNRLADIEAIKKLGTEIGVNSIRLKSHALAIYQDTVEFNRLSRSQKEIVKGFAESSAAYKKQKEYLDTIRESVEKNHSAYVDFGRMIGGVFGGMIDDGTKSLDSLGGAFQSIGGVVKDVSKFLGIEFETAFHRAKKAQNEAIKSTEGQEKKIQDLKSAYESLAKEMGIITNQGYAELIKNAEILNKTFIANEGRILANNDLLKNMKEKVWEVIEQYHKAGKDVPIYIRQISSKLLDATINQDNFVDTVRGGFPTMEELAKNFEKETQQAYAAGEKISNLEEQSKKLAKTNTSLAQSFKDVVGFMNQCIGSLESLGLLSESTSNQLGGMVSGLGAIGTGIDTIKNAGKGVLGFLGKFTGTLGIVSGAVSIFTSVIDLLKGKSGELEAAERRLSGLSGVTGDWAAKVEELAKQIGGADSAGRAFNILLSDIIRSSDITTSNFSSFVRKVREVVATFEQGFASISETEKNFGAAFSALTEQAHRLGLEGGVEMTGLILLAEEFGLKVREIQEYIENNKKVAVEGYRQYLEAAFSDIRIGVLDEWVEFEDKVKNNQTLVDGVKGVSDSLIGLSNNIRLSQEQYNNFQLAASDAYNSLITQGFTSNEALQVMQPMLERLAFLQQQFGYQVDDTTVNLINQGIEAGLISEDMKTENQLMLEGFDRIVERLDMIAMGLGVKIPDALGSMETASGRALDSISRYTGNWSGQLDTIYNQFDDLGRTVSDFDDLYYQHMKGHSVITLTQEWIDVLETVDQTIYTIGDTLKILDFEYTVLIKNMGDQTRRFAIDAQGNMRSLLDTLALIGNQTKGDIGSRYGVYSDEEKQAMTAEYFQLTHLWADSRATILSSEESMRRFLSDIESLVVIDEAKERYDKFLASMRQWYTHLTRGETWNEETDTWIKPTSAARGIQFIVPPGYENENLGFPLYVHSGELVQVYPREDTRRILSNDLYHYRKVGTDTFTPTPFEIPQQTLFDFFTPPDDLFSPEGSDQDIEIQLNDGVAPVYVPGQTDSKKEINININHHITIDVRGESGNSDNDELAEKIAEKLNDNYRGFKDEVALIVLQELKKELDL